MRLGFVARLVRRELRRLGAGFPLVLGSIAIGVAALVAVRSFTADVRRAVADQGRELLGADLVVRSRRPFPDSVVAALDSARAAGARVASVTEFASMGYASGSDGARLVRVRAVEPGYPFYGTPRTEPKEIWWQLGDERWAIVDPVLLAQLAIQPGDTLSLGDGRFTIAGTLTRGPDAAGPATALAPTVVIAATYLAETGLLTYGSLGVYEAYLGFPRLTDAQAFVDGHDVLFRTERVTWQTAAALERELVGELAGASRFLSLVGLLALAFSAVGVMSAVRLFAVRKVDSTAILRCLGATRLEVLAAYLSLASVVATAGAVLGVAVGVAIQFGAPRALRAFLPAQVSSTIHWGAVAGGLGVGVWVAVLAALPPLLSVRRVSPLRALRRDVEALSVSTRRDPAQLGALALLVVSFLTAAALELQSVPRSFAFAAGFAVAALALRIVAGALIRGARWASSRAGAPVWRHGLANLHRPGNQALAVTLSLGFAAALVATTHLVAGSVLKELSVDTGEARSNLVLFDIQRDQLEEVTSLVPAPAAPIPIIPARLYRVNDDLVTDLLADSSGGTNRWVLRREYRVTYRDSLGPDENVVAGQSWSGPSAPDALSEASLDREIASDLGIGLGDHLTLDVQGVRVETVITSLRDVRFTRLEPNFFLIVQSGALDQAPGMFVLLTRLPDATARGRLLRAVAERFANVVGLDLTLLQRSLDEIVGRIAGGVRFISVICIATGVLVLLGAVAASRLQRLGEAALLRTLGATSAQVRSIMLAEYAALGLAGTIAGAGLGTGAAWLLCRFYLGVPFAALLTPVALGAVAAGMATAFLGWLGSRGLFSRPPLVVLRAD